jgi:hypothetical protein
MTDKHWADALRDMNACGDAVQWARTMPSAAQAWRRCHRADWLLWIAGRLAKTGAACRGARRV